MSKIRGYGVELPACEWAKLLGLSALDIFYYLDQKGLSIEDLFNIRGIKYKTPRQRKPREGAQMKKTKERIAILLEMSGISDRNDTSKIEVKIAGTHPAHLVYYNGAIFGVYNYRTGALKLSGGQGIPLWDLEWEDAKVVQSADGLWQPHKDTHALLIARIVKSDPPKTEQLTEVYGINKQVADQRENARQTYEGFGKRLTKAEWARVLRVPKNTLGLHLNRGETVEAFAAKRGIKSCKK